AAGSRVRVRPRLRGAARVRAGPRVPGSASGLHARAVGVEWVRMGLAAGVLALLIPRRRATRSGSRLLPKQRIIASLVQAFAHCVVLGALLAALPATSTAQYATIARVLTDWGTFRCAAIRCTPERSVLSFYWSAPTLYVTKDHVPMLRRQCALVSAR